MIAPLAMKLREQGVKVKIAYLGHRDGSTVMVRSDLAGEVAEGPSGAHVRDPEQIQQPESGDSQVDAGSGRRSRVHPLRRNAAARHAGRARRQSHRRLLRRRTSPRALGAGWIGKVLYHAKDIWPRFISCVLVVTEDLIAKRPAVVKDLVRGIAESGEWAESHRVEAARLVSPYFRQDERLAAPCADAAARSRELSHADAWRRRDAEDGRHGATRRRSSTPGSTCAAWSIASSFRRRSKPRASTMPPAAATQP